MPRHPALVAVWRPLQSKRHSQVDLGCMEPCAPPSASNIRTMRNAFQNKRLQQMRARSVTCCPLQASASAKARPYQACLPKKMTGCCKRWNSRHLSFHSNAQCSPCSFQLHLYDTMTLDSVHWLLAQHAVSFIAVRHRAVQNCKLPGNITAPASTTAAFLVPTKVIRRCLW